MKLSILLGILLCLPCAGQTITETFGTGANAFSIEFVEIGNPGNPADTTGLPNPAGSVSYVYNIGKYEISRDIISKAINSGLNNGAIGTAGNNGLSGVQLGDMTSFGGNGVNRPATGISLYEAVRFVNYLNTSQGYSAAYKFDGSAAFVKWAPSDSGYNSNNEWRNSSARYFLPTVHEWYKAAYFDPSKSAYYNFATGSDLSPTPTAGSTLLNTAVYNQNFNNGPADVNNAGGLSPFGTMAQSGNVNEWVEYSWNTQLARGAWWNCSGNEFNLGVQYYSTAGPPDQNEWTGFRIASVPEPSSLSLLLAGGAVFAAARRRKVD